MPCCVDTIVKIKQVCITDKKETNLTVIWTIGTYPVEVEDRDMEMVLVVPFDKFERDFNTQSVFRKDEYYSIDRKITPESYNDNLKLKMIVVIHVPKIDFGFLSIIVAISTHLAIKKEPGLNRYTAKEINTENAMIKGLYWSKEKDEYYSIDRKITPESYNDNLKLKMIVVIHVPKIDFGFLSIIVAISTHLAIKKEPGLNRYTAKEINTENAMIKGLYWSKEQMEIIQKDLYIYTVETPYVDVSTDKKEVYNSSQSALDYMFKYNKEYVNEDDELEENVINQNEKNKHNGKKVENIIHKGEHMIEYNKKYTDKGNNLGEKVVSQNKNNEHNHEKM
ncbi:hypothetical protein Glove_194g54 [Diversispora epigaea]|uniref:Uncharacterized protein n=1 Tax=Diversispora epigaea TaxID=1348612 RepID=A0A397IP28_9GLOM|nr:hypothetical protein Glove_194g54 [Diversispora epigaea]